MSKNIKVMATFGLILMFVLLAVLFYLEGELGKKWGVLLIALSAVIGCIEKIWGEPEEDKGEDNSAKESK